MDSAIKTYRENEYAKEKHANTKTKVFQDYNLRAYMDDITATGIKMTPSELSELEGEGTLDDAGVKKILDFQNERTDEKILAQFTDGSVLVNLSADQIQDLPDISYTDKQSLLKQREGAG